MKKELIVWVAALAFPVAVLTASCNHTGEGDKAVVTEQKTAAQAQGEQYNADIAASKVRFTGNGVGKAHSGTFKLQSGNVFVASNQLTGGSFVVDINSLELDEKGGMYDAKLHPHLLSTDFLDAQKYGTAKFEITSVSPYKADNKDGSVVEGANYTVSGNLTMKDVTKNVTFPARVDIDDNMVKAKAKFDIDRTQWHIIYGNDKSLGDKFISETVNIDLDIQAKK